MPTDTKDLETLRAESQQIGSRITRLCIILISALVIVTFTITNTLEKVDVRELKQNLDNATMALEFLSGTYRRHLNETKQQPPSSNPKEDNAKDPIHDAYSKALNEKIEAQRKFDAAMKESLSISLPILGTGLKIDLRTWIYSIPFISIIAVVYIQILRKKQRVLSAIAALQIFNNAEANKLDQLTFSEFPGLETPYARNPSQLEQIVYLLIIIFLISFIIVALDQADIVLLGLGTIETLQYLLMLLTISFYGLSYYYYVATALDKQTAAIAGWVAKPTILIRAWRKLRVSVLAFSSRVKPKISLTTGAFLILASLFLSTSASCDQNGQVVRLPGHKLLQEPGGQIWKINQSLDTLEKLLESLKDSESSQDTADPVKELEDRLARDPGGGWWISTIEQPKWEGLYWRYAIHNLGRIAYSLGLGVAILTLLIVLYRLIRKKHSKLKKVHVALFLLSITLSLIVITDYAFNTFWFKDELFLLSNLFWIVPLAFLLHRTLSHKENAHSHWTLIKSSLVILLLPLTVCAAIYVGYVTWDGFWGVLTYFIGINLISLAYLQIVKGEPANNEAASMNP